LSYPAFPRFTADGRNCRTWHLLKYNQEFDWKVFEKEEAKMRRKKLARLQNMAASLNLRFVPLP
jgi:hypothetical protein